MVSVLHLAAKYQHGNGQHERLRRRLVARRVVIWRIVFEGSQVAQAEAAADGAPTSRNLKGGVYMEYQLIPMEYQRIPMEYQRIPMEY